MVKGEKDAAGAGEASRDERSLLQDGSVRAEVALR